MEEGLPYRDEGDGPPVGGINCYRVLMGLYAVVGIDLPDMGHHVKAIREDEEAWPLARSLGAYDGLFRYVDTEREKARIGDVVLFELPRQPIHVAVIETQDRIVHAAERVGLHRMYLHELRRARNLKVIRYVGPGAEKLQL